MSLFPGSTKLYIFMMRIIQLEKVWVKASLLKLKSSRLITTAWAGSKLRKIRPNPSPLIIISVRTKRYLFFPSCKFSSFIMFHWAIGIICNLTDPYWASVSILINFSTLSRLSDDFGMGKSSKFCQCHIFFLSWLQWGAIRSRWQLWSRIKS